MNKYNNITIANPSCKSNTQAGSANTLLTAATRAEQGKRRKYQACLVRASIPPDKFIPFAIEATGRFGTEAMDFFNLVMRESRLILQEKSPNPCM